jgi:hypothetical protein
MNKLTVKGDFFDVKGRIGLEDRPRKPNHVNIDYSDPAKKLAVLNYDQTQNFLLHWNPFVFEKNHWTNTTNVKALHESM